MSDYCKPLEELKRMVEYGGTLEEADEIVEELQKMADDLEKYKRALNKACDGLSELNDCHNLGYSKYRECPFTKQCSTERNFVCYSKDKNKWKEWLMKDE